MRCYVIKAKTCFQAGESAISFPVNAFHTGSQKRGIGLAVRKIWNFSGHVFKPKIKLKACFYVKT